MLLPDAILWYCCDDVLEFVPRQGAKRFNSRRARLLRKAGSSIGVGGRTDREGIDELGGMLARPAFDATGPSTQVRASP